MPADAWIDDGQVDGPPGEVPVRCAEQKGSLFDVARRDLVCDVDEESLGCQAQEGAFESPNIVVLGSKVGEQRDYSLRWSLRWWLCWRLRRFRHA